jgi:beta-barrel assembly-enhancing protease
MFGSTGIKRALHAARLARSFAILTLACILVEASASGQRIPKPGFNLFSKDQDIQLGKEAASEIEKTAKVVNDGELNAYIQEIGKKLAAAPEANDYPYTFKVVHDDSINAFALPGGPTYVNTGLIVAADNEAQLVGVMAHEISHVALRHGTNQASKSQLISLPAMLGSSVGGGSLLGKIAQAGIGLGANSVLMKFSRGAESDADLLGARMMARAGYDPTQAARFFEKLEAETGKRSGIEQFFSSHPNPGNRTKRIEAELPHLPKGPYTTDSGKLANMQASVKRLGAAPKPQPAAQPGGATPASQPSSRFVEYQGTEFRFSHPDNWKSYPDQSAKSVTVAPTDGLVKASGGEVAVGRGLIASFAAADKSRRIDLERETGALIQQLQSGNPALKPTGKGSRRSQLDGETALVTSLSNESPYGAVETDVLVTVARPEGLYYVVLIAPESEFQTFEPTFQKILQSMRLNR